MWNWSSRSYRLHSIEWASNWGWFTSLLESAELLKWLHQSYPCRDEHFIRLWCWPDVSCLRVWCQIALVSRFRCISLFCFERWHFLPRGQRDARNSQRLLHFSPKGWTLRPHPFFEHFEDELHALWMEGLPCYSTDQKSLQEWAWKTIHWTNQTCGWTTKNNVSSSSPPFDQGSIDLRLKKQLDGAGWYFRRYPQLFEAKHGFVSGCSILDSLFIMGPDELNRQLDQLVALHSS